MSSVWTYSSGNNAWRVLIETHREALAERLYNCWREAIAEAQQLGPRELRRTALPWENLRVPPQHTGVLQYYWPPEPHGG
jgi:hypothetical protein